MSKLSSVLDGARAAKFGLGLEVALLATDSVQIHPSAEVSDRATIGAGTRIWHQSQVREGAVIGADCVLSKGVYVDEGVVVGSRVKIQNYVSLYKGVVIEDGVFCGPHCVFTNDLSPRSIAPDGRLKGPDDWTLTKTVIKKGASIGANATVVCGIEVGAWAMVGAGAVVVNDVPAQGIVVGVPAQLVGFACRCGQTLRNPEVSSDGASYVCEECGERSSFDRKLHARLE